MTNSIKPNPAKHVFTSQEASTCSTFENAGGYSEHVVVRNDKPGSGLEDRSGFVEWLENGAHSNEVIKGLEDMPCGSFIPQPLGKQKFPDILVRDFDGAFYVIECKSSEDGSISWNDQFAHVNAIYVCSSFYDTTCFLGEHVTNEAAEAAVAEFKRRMKEYSRCLAEELLTPNNKGIETVRPKFKELVPTNYLHHPQRHEFEQDVLDVASGEKTAEMTIGVRKTNFKLDDEFSS